MSELGQVNRAYRDHVMKHLDHSFEANEAAMDRVSKKLVKQVTAGGSLLAFGSGHSSIFALELYHRAGGPSFVIPLVADYLLPLAGPPVVRILERTAGVANMLLARVGAGPGDMLWLCSQSGINAAVVDLAMKAREKGVFTVAFTSRAHSEAVESRHASQKRLFEVCDETIDLGGVRGDAAIEVAPGVKAGPLSSLGAIFLAHSILVPTCASLERAGTRCVYTSVNTPEGESRNKDMEKKASVRDALLRE